MNEGRQKEPSNILVVDDEEAIRYTYDLAISDAGYTVFYAECGEEAWEILGDEDINVIFLDLNLPDMSGIELCRQIRCVKPNAYILAITGYATHFDIAECYQAELMIIWKSLSVWSCSKLQPSRLSSRSRQ